MKYSDRNEDPDFEGTESEAVPSKSADVIKVHMDFNGYISSKL